MKNNALEKIQSIIFSTYRQPLKPSPSSKAPLVAVARDFGSGGAQMAALLAKKLSVTCYDQEILAKIVAHAKTDRHLSACLDEKSPSMFDDLVRQILSDKAGSRDNYFEHLVKILVGIAPAGGVIVGRAAHLILASHGIFRVRITGSLEKCAQQVAERKSVDIAAARALVKQTNRERTEFVREVFDHRPATEAYYDLVLNSDRLTPEAMTEIVLDVMKKMDFPMSVPRKG